MSGVRLERLWHDRRAAPYLFVAPFVVLFCVFGLFYITSGPRLRVFAGWQNFAFMFRDPDFYKAVRNTGVFALCSVCLQLPLSLGLALLLNRRDLAGRNTFRLCFFSPRLVGMVFVGVLFSLIFASKTGLIDALLTKLTGEVAESEWLKRPRLVMPCLVATALWMYVGFNMIYFLAALQAVDATLYEAAKVDGAGAVRQFLHVTLPGIRPVAIFVVVLSTIGSFQLFELPYLMLGNGPGPDGAALTIVMYLYQNGLVAGDLGYASAVGWTLVVGVLGLALVQMRLGGTWKREE